MTIRLILCHAEFVFLLFSLIVGPVYDGSHVLCLMGIITRPQWEMKGFPALVSHLSPGVVMLLVAVLTG